MGDASSIRKGELPCETVELREGGFSALGPDSIRLDGWDSRRGHGSRHALMDRRELGWDVITPGLRGREVSGSVRSMPI